MAFAGPSSNYTAVSGLVRALGYRLRQRGSCSAELCLGFGIMEFRVCGLGRYLRYKRSPPFRCFNQGGAF